MFWGAVLKDGESLQRKEIFKQKEYPTLHLSQAVLVGGKQARLSVQATKDSEPIVIAILNEQQQTGAISVYISRDQVFSISVKSSDDAEVHLCGHFTAEGHDAEDQMFFGGSDEEDKKDEKPKNEQEWNK